MANEEINIPINFDTDGAEKALNSLQGTVEKFAEIAAAYFSASAIIGFLKESVAQATEAEDAFASLTLAMKSTGEFSNEAADGMQSFASAIQETTKFSDDAAVQALAMAKNFGLTNEQAQRLVTAATDLASVERKDLGTATEQLLQSLNGQVKSLKTVNAEFGNLTETQARNGGAINVIEKQYSTVAETLRGTFSGALASAANNFNDIYENSGRQIITNQAVIDSINELSAAFVNVSKEVNQNSKDIGLVITAAAQTFSFLIKSVVATKDAFFVFTEAAARSLIVMNNFARAMADLVSGDFAGAKKEIAAAGLEFDGFKGYLDKTSFGFRDLSKETDAHTKSAVANADTQKKLSTEFRKSQETLKDYQKSLEDAKKFEEEIHKNSLDDIGKLDLARSQAYDKIAEFEKKIPGFTQKADLLRLEVDIDYFRKKGELQKRQLDDETREVEKAVDDQRKLIESLTKEPYKIIFEDIQLSADNLTAAGAGFVDKMLDGAKGAKALISDGIGTGVATALGNPALAGIFSSIVGKLAEGPDAVKEFVRGFIDAIPEIMQNVGESIPVVVEALVDSLINRGGAAKIGIAIAIAFSGYPIVKALGQQIGNDFAVAARTALIGAIALSIQPLSALFLALPPQMRQSIADGANAFAVKIREAIGDGASQMTKGLASVFAGATTALAGGIYGALKDGGTWVFGEIADGAKRLRDKFFEPIDRLIDFLDKFKFPDINIPGLGGGGGGGGVGGAIDKAKGEVNKTFGTHFATGGVIPRGFPNDSYPSNLTSNERVLDPTRNDRFERLLDQLSIQGVGGASAPTQIVLQIGEQQLAKVMLNLNRQGFRTA